MLSRIVTVLWVKIVRGMPLKRYAMVACWLVVGIDTLLRSSGRVECVFWVGSDRPHDRMDHGCDVKRPIGPVWVAASIS